MTVVYRAYSPSRDTTHGVTDDRDHVAGTVSILNQSALVTDSVGDRVMQTGTVEWETT